MKHWKDSFMIDGVTFYLIGFKGERKAVFFSGEKYRCYVQDEVMGVTLDKECETWEETSEFLK